MLIHSPFVLEQLAHQNVREALKEAEARALAARALRTLPKAEGTDAGPAASRHPHLRRLVGGIGRRLVSVGRRLEQLGSPSYT